MRQHSRYTTRESLGKYNTMRISDSGILLIEDHDQALEIWRDKKIKGLDLVHIDAHIDFGIQPAKPLQKILEEGKSLKEIKKNLEYSLAFMHYEKDLNKQTNIGNYVYPAMEEGIVRNFYWIVPGRSKEFNESSQLIQKTLMNLLKENGGRTESKRQKLIHREDGIISTQFKGSDLTVCSLEKLPVLRRKVLLDIDTDFLVTDSLLDANSTRNIKKRKPWILPQDFVNRLKEKIKHPQVITIAYSVNGGYTPMKYKHFGDEIAYLLAPKIFQAQFEKNYQAARYFNLFLSTGKKEFYSKAIRLNPTYRVADNNYGTIYLSLRKLSFAEKEFLKILKADPKNPASLLGLGEIAYARKDYKKAKPYFSAALSSEEDPMFAKTGTQALLGLAKTEYALKSFKKAKEFLIRHKALKPLQPESYYLLGLISEKEKGFIQAAVYYKDAIRLGYGDIDPLERLARMSFRLKDRDDLKNFVNMRHRELKKRYLEKKRLESMKGKKTSSLLGIEGKMWKLEKMLHNNLTSEEVRKNEKIHKTQSG